MGMFQGKGLNGSILSLTGAGLGIVPKVNSANLYSTTAGTFDSASNIYTFTTEQPVKTGEGAGQL